MRQIEKKTWKPPLKKSPSTFSVIVVLLFILLVLAWIYSSWISSTNLSVINGRRKEIIFSENKRISEVPLNCSNGNLTQTCSSNYPMKFTTLDDDERLLNATCPEYFRWIHEDLKPFKATGITREMVERAKKTAHFRLVIVKGKVYVEKFKKSIQTRDVFTLWGILQLLRRYPGRLPDLELMFDCDDRPVIKSRSFHDAIKSPPPPPLFRYCGDPWTLDIAFPDWSFWGWAEINIRPWENLLKEIKEGNKRTKWMERIPYAYWKGNPFVADTRKDLLKCNVTEKQDWNAHLFIQDWIREYEQGYKESGLGNQCKYRYKIYIEGYAWSVSEKYILACDSPTLLVNTNFYDFFLRSLQPVHHYWPIRTDDKCRSIKFAVAWGNNHKQKAQEIGKAASSFIQEELKMDYVYDYVFHLLNEYAKLLKFEPGNGIPERAVEICSETMACHAEGNQKKFMMESLVKRPSITSPCNLPTPFEPQVLGAFMRRKANSMKVVEKWERNFWEKL